MLKILSIGNSFSQDAHRYLYGVAKQNGSDFKAVNLYISGCSLRIHYLNIIDNKADYSFEFNGKSTGLKVSIDQALASDDWDVITLQQVSFASIKYETYTPYLEFIYDHIKKYCPKAKIYMHQTWAYEEGSNTLKNNTMKNNEGDGYLYAKDMLEDIKRSYAAAANAIGADGIIPCGQAMFNATQMGIEKVHRDSFHATFGVGRYILALTWYKALTGKDITKDSFSELDRPVSAQEREIAIKAVNAAFE